MSRIGVTMFGKENNDYMKLASLWDSLLPKLMRGDVRMKDELGRLASLREDSVFVNDEQ